MTHQVGAGGLLAGMDQDRDRRARDDFRREREAALSRKLRPQRLPPGNRSVQTILELERAINEGAQLSVLETDHQWSLRVSREP